MNTSRAGGGQGWAAGQIESTLAELEQAQLLLRLWETDEAFTFKHVLTQEAVYKSLTVRQRKQIHLQVAAAYEEIYEGRLDEQAAFLAYHYERAGDPERTLTYATIAGLRAVQRYANAEARLYYSQAIAAAQQLNRPGFLLYQARGRVHETLGELESARSDFEAGLAEARERGDRQAEWEGLLDLGRLYAGSDYGAVGRCYREALVLAEAMGDPRARARTLNWLGNWHINVDEVEEAQQSHLEALRIFEELGDEVGRAETLDLLGMADWLRGDALAALEYTCAAVDRYRAMDNRRGLCSVLATSTLAQTSYQTTTLVMEPASRSLALERCREAIDLARQIGWRSGESYALLAQAWCLAPSGNYTRGLASAEQALAVAEAIGHRQWMTATRCGLGSIYVDVFAGDQAIAHLEQAQALADRIGSVHWRYTVAGFLAMAYLHEGRLDEAEGLAGRATTPPKTVGHRLCTAALVEVALARGEGARALAILDDMLAHTHHMADHGLEAIPYLARLRGEALLLCDRPAEALETLVLASRGAGKLELASEIWRAHLALARAYRTIGDPDLAGQALAVASAAIENAAAALPTSRLRSIFLERANDMKAQVDT